MLIVFNFIHEVSIRNFHKFVFKNYFYSYLQNTYIETRHLDIMISLIQEQASKVNFQLYYVKCIIKTLG